MISFICGPRLYKHKIKYKTVMKKEVKLPRGTKGTNDVGDTEEEGYRVGGICQNAIDLQRNSLR